MHIFIMLNQGLCKPQPTYFKRSTDDFLSSEPVLLLLDFYVMIFWSPYSQYAWHQIFWTSIYHQNFISVWRLQCSVIVNLKCWVNKPETYSNNCFLILTVVLGWACLRYGLLKFQRAKLESCPNILKLLHSAQLVTFLLPDLRLAQLNVSYTHAIPWYS